MLVVVAMRLDASGPALFVRPFQEPAGCDHVVEGLAAILAELGTLGIGEGLHVGTGQLREAVLVDIAVVWLAIDVGPEAFGVIGFQLELDVGVNADEMGFLDGIEDSGAKLDAHFAVELQAFPGDIVDDRRGAATLISIGQECALSSLPVHPLNLIKTAPFMDKDDDLLNVLKGTEQRHEVVDVLSPVHPDKKLPPGGPRLIVDVAWGHECPFAVVLVLNHDFGAWQAEEGHQRIPVLAPKLTALYLNHRIAWHLVDSGEACIRAQIGPAWHESRSSCQSVGHGGRVNATSSVLARSLQALKALLFFRR